MIINRPKFKIVCDVETSGSCPIRNGVISACILVIDEHCNVVDEFIRNVCPPDLTKKWWSLEAQGIHGISYETVQTYMPNDQFCYELLIFLSKYRGESAFDFICHANPSGWFSKTEGWIIIKWFDYNFLEWCFRKAKFKDGTEMVWTMNKVISSSYLISTVKMGKEAGHKKNNLKVWSERIGFDLKHHDPTSDTYCCLEIYKHLRATNEDSFGNKLQVGIQEPSGLYNLPGTNEEHATRLI